MRGRSLLRTHITTSKNSRPEYVCVCVQVNKRKESKESNIVLHVLVRERVYVYRVFFVRAWQWISASALYTALHCVRTIRDKDAGGYRISGRSYRFIDVAARVNRSRTVVVILTARPSSIANVTSRDRVRHADVAWRATECPGEILRSGRLRAPVPDVGRWAPCVLPAGSEGAGRRRGPRSERESAAWNRCLRGEERKRESFFVFVCGGKNCQNIWRTDVPRRGGPQMFCHKRMHCTRKHVQSNAAADGRGGLSGRAVAKISPKRIDARKHHSKMINRFPHPSSGPWFWIANINRTH